MRLAKLLKQLVMGAVEGLRERSVETLRLELLELEHAFLSLVVGSFVGIPVVPLGIAVELAPLLADELKILRERSARGADALSDVFASMGGEW
jgi:hypothetical protein